MENRSQAPANNPRNWLLLGSVSIMVLLVITAFAGWLHFGSSILLDMAASGLSWCF